jgi:hypothetical protein
VHPDYAVRYRTAKRALPCSQIYTHGKEIKHGKFEEEHTAMKHSRQRSHKTHSKFPMHGKEGNQPTTKKRSTAKVPSLAVHTFYALCPNYAHGKGAFAVRRDVVHGKGVLCRALVPLPCAI